MPVFVSGDGVDKGLTGSFASGEAGLFGMPTCGDAAGVGVLSCERAVDEDGVSVFGGFCRSWSTRGD